MIKKENLSILLYGQFNQNHLGASFQRAFQELGHNVIAVDQRQARQYLAPWFNNPLVHRLTNQSMQARRLGSRQWNEHILQVGQDIKPDLFLIIKGNLVMPETLSKFNQSGIPVFLFHPDNPFPPFSSNLPETIPCALETDCYLIWSRSLKRRLEAIPVKRTAYLPFAWDTEVYPYEMQSRAPEYDLVFIGGWDKEREAWLSPLAQIFDLRIWGPNYWQTRTHPKSPLRHCWQGKEIWGAKACMVYRQSRIVLNFLRKQNLPDGTNMRTFEVPGSGAFLLSNRSQGAAEIFPEGLAGAYFETGEECIEQIQYYLNQEKKRLELAHTAHNIVNRCHQYTDRARSILDIYKNL